MVVTAPTVMTLLQPAGVYSDAFWLSFPDDATTTTPAFTASSIADCNEALQLALLPALIFITLAGVEFKGEPMIGKPAAQRIPATRSEV